jgi:hypothetical protein
MIVLNKKNQILCEKTLLISNSKLTFAFDQASAAILKARTAAVPMVRAFRYSLTLTPEIKSLITWKNILRRIAQRTRNEDDKRRFEFANVMVRDACEALNNDSFGRKLANFQPNHKSLFNFTKIIKNTTFKSQRGNPYHS